MYDYNITSAQYFRDFNGDNVSITAIINGQEWSVPMDTDNTDYQDILAWVAEGNTIADAE